MKILIVVEINVVNIEICLCYQSEVSYQAVQLAVSNSFCNWNHLKGSLFCDPQIWLHPVRKDIEPIHCNKPSITYLLSENIYLCFVNNNFLQVITGGMHRYRVGQVWVLYICMGLVLKDYGS